ncbi:MAG: FG-GAP repeat protein, partial [Planctomycetota bacterium]
MVFEDAKLTASDASPGDRFGSGLDLDGDLAVIGADHLQHDNTWNLGVVYVNRFDGTAWTEEAILTPDAPLAGRGFGFSTSVSGDVIAVGAPAAPNTGLGPGAAYIFRYDGTTWIEEARLAPDQGGLFGISVAVDGDVLAVGAYLEDSGAGAVYMYRHDGSSWIREARLTASDASPGDELGRPIALDGNVVLAAAKLDDDAGTNSGSAYVFRYDGANWNEEAKLIAPDGSGFDWFGQGVSVDREAIIVGSRLDDFAGMTDVGSAHVFRYDGLAWIHEAKLTASDGADYDSFGHQVSICRNVAVVVSPADDDAGDVSGSGYVFVYDGSAWVETAKLLASDGSSGDLLGGTVAACENAVLGAGREDSAGNDAGAVFYYAFPDGDADGLNDYHERFYGTDAADADTDDDGLLDGTEIDIAEDSGCPDALDLDSDGDTLLDGDEVALGTDPCSTDTDGDTVPDNEDDLPTVPGSSGLVEAALRSLCGDVEALDLSRIDAKNDNARAGRQNAMCNKLNAAANAVAAGDYDDAIDQLDSLLAKLDGLPKPKDWMTDSPERDAIVTAIQEMIVLLELLS